ncbi:MAG: anti-sigma factor [Burkholderiales bacterium]|nr:anti-sigma factor [Burkholderiales bacterium]
MNAPDDTLLSAWLDDELPPEQRAEVEAWLREHPEDAARVRLWALDAEALRARLDGVLGEPVPQALAQVTWRKAPDTLPGVRWQRWVAALAIFVLGGAVGAAVMWRLPAASGVLARGGEPAWVQRAAVAHAVYVPEVRHAVEVKAQEEHLSRWLTRRLTVPVKLFDLRAQGFELVGGRLLPDAAGTPSAQLMYQALPDTGATGSDGKPLRVTVYLRKPDSSTPAAFRYERQGELGLFYWVEGESAEGGACGYALVGTLPKEKLLALAEAVYKQGPQAQ